jgi:phospholipid transport system substrate-binding protein
MLLFFERFVMKKSFCAAAMAALLVPFAPAAAQVAGVSGAAAVSITGHGSAIAEGFVADNIAKSLAILNNAGLSEPQRREQFQALLLSLTDSQRIATFTLGQYAKNTPQADQDAFANAFQAYSIAVYRSYFSRFAGQTLTVTGSSQRAPADFIVATKLNDPHDHSGQAPLEVDFRVRTDAGRPEITDLSVMGVWLALSQRDEFVSYLAAHKGSVPNLTAHIVDVTAQLGQPGR